MLDSPRRFARVCANLGIALAIIGAVGLVDRWLVLPLAALVLLFAVLAVLVDAEREQAPVAAPPIVGPPTVAPPAVADTGETDETPTVVRRFDLPVEVGAEQAWLVGDFNGWSTTATPMDRDGDRFVADVALVPGRSYRYRFLLDDGRWENDWHADRYVPNAFGDDDCVVDA